MACSSKIKVISEKVPLAVLVGASDTQDFKKLINQYFTYNLKAISKIVAEIDENNNKPGDTERKKRLLSFIVHSLNNRVSDTARETEKLWLSESKKTDALSSRNMLKTTLRASKAFYTIRAKKIYDFFSNSVLFLSDKKNRFELSLTPQKIDYVKDEKKETINGVGIHGKFLADSVIYADLMKELDDGGYVLMKDPKKDARVSEILALNIKPEDENSWFDEKRCVYINTNKNKEPPIIVVQRMPSSGDKTTLNFRAFFRDRIPRYIPPSAKSTTSGTSDKETRITEPVETKKWGQSKKIKEPTDESLIRRGQGRPRKQNPKGTIEEKKKRGRPKKQI